MKVWYNNYHWRLLPRRTVAIISCFLLLLIFSLPSRQGILVQAFTAKDSLPAVTKTVNSYDRPFSTTQHPMSSRTWIDSIGSSALRNVQNLAQSVTRANDEGLSVTTPTTPVVQPRNTGDTGKLFSRAKDKPGMEYDDSQSEEDGMAFVTETGPLPILTGGEATISTAAGSVISTKGKNRKVVLSALESLERDMQLLDNITAQKPQLSRLEITLLSFSVIAAGSGPVFFMDGAKVAEVLAPACAALSAAIGIGAEYTGKVAVADGKEVAAATLQCAAEAEAFLAKAERVKAVTPLCVGISATAATLSLVAPVVLENLSMASGSPVAVELYLLSPLVAVLAASVASLSLQETRQFVSTAISVGNRRFAKSGLVGRTWLSASEQIEKNSLKTTERWRSFSWSVLPAPIVGSLIPGVLSTKAVIVAALAAAQCAFFLAQAENALARGTDAVALKARSAAVCDTYANQGARSAAILPFTSALSSLCAAATAAIVELPWLEYLGSLGGIRGTVSSVSLLVFFPALSSLFAAAASVSKARCEVDAEAAIQASSTLALEYDDEDDPVLKPFRGVAELIRLTLSTTWKSFKKSRFSRKFLQPVWLSIKNLFQPNKQK